MKIEEDKYHTECLNNTDLKTWDRFINDNNGGFFQSLLYYNICTQLEEFDPTIIVTYNGDSIVGSILVVIQTSGNHLKKYLSRRALVIGGPIIKAGLVDNKIVAALLLAGLNEHIDGKAIYTEFRNLFDLREYIGEFNAKGYKFKKHYNVQLSISNLESINRRISSSKRRQIRKSLSNGVEIIQADIIDEVRVFYEILTELYKSKVKKPLPSWEFYKKLFELSKTTDNVRYLLLRFKGNIIGGILAPIYNNTIYEWYIAHKEFNDKNIYPGVLATWAAIEYGINHNLKQFDFLGAGSPNEEYGVREFKLKFGGDLVQNGRFIRINQAFLYRLGLIGMRFIRKF